MNYELLRVQCSLFWAIECDWNVFFALDIEAKIRGSKSWCREQLKIHRDQFVVESLSTITIFFNLNLTSPIILRRMSKKEKGSLWDHHQQVKCKGRHLSEIEKKVYGGYWYHARWEIAGKKCQADPSSWSLGAGYSGLNETHILITLLHLTICHDHLHSKLPFHLLLHQLRAVLNDFPCQKRVQKSH